MLPFDRKYFVDLVYKRSTALLTSVGLTEAVTGSTQSVRLSRFNGLFLYISDSVQLQNLKSEIEISEVAGPWFLEKTLVSEYSQKLPIASLRYLVIIYPILSLRVLLNNYPIIPLRYLLINYPIIPLRSRTQGTFCARSEILSFLHKLILRSEILCFTS